jgi:uncharacterized protein YqjF (DUF2071 family)
MKYLKRHPFPVVARFDRVVAVSFAFPREILRPMVPAGLEIDSYDGLGFVTVALVWTRQLRPAGFPAFLGHDFFLAGYRIFTRLQDETGRRLRGLKILGSETDKRRMVMLGNLMTGYNYRQVKVDIEITGTATRIQARRDDGHTTLDLSFDDCGGKIGLPDDSPFPDWRTARRFAGPMPFTFSPQDDGSFVVIEGTRAEWSPRPVRLLDWQVGIFQDSPLADATPLPANAFAVNDIYYRWERGRIVKSTKPA